MLASVPSRASRLVERLDQSRAVQYAFAPISAVAAIFLRQGLGPILCSSYPLATLYGAVAVALPRESRKRRHRRCQMGKDSSARMW